MIQGSLERSLAEVSRLVLEQGNAAPGLCIALEMVLGELEQPVPTYSQAPPPPPPPANETEPAPRPPVRITNENGDVRARPNVPEAAGAAQTIDDLLRWNMRRKLHPAAVELLALVSRVHLLEEALADASDQVHGWEAAAERNGWSL